jgi:hypothetical protein
MPRVRDLLYRFRPSGVPGGASAAGVPIDRAATVAAELEPVFGQLSAVESECDGIRDDTGRDVATIKDSHAGRARAIAAAATGRVGSERAAVVARMRDLASADAAAELSAARVEAAALRELAAERMPGYVERVVAMVREFVSDEHRTGVS